MLPGKIADSEAPSTSPRPTRTKAKKVEETEEEDVYELPALMKLVGAGALEMKDALMLHMFGKLTRGTGVRSMGQKTLETEDGGDDLLEEMKNKGLQAMKNLSLNRRRIVEEPESYWKEFEKDCMEQLGASEGEAWSLDERRRKIYFGKMVGLNRCIAMDIEVYRDLKAKSSRRRGRV